MIIGFVLDDGLDKPDGVQQNILTIGGWLEAGGHEVHYLVGETASNYASNIHSMSRNLKVKFNGNSLTTPFPAQPSRIGAVLNSAAFDVLHIQIPYSPFMAGRIIKKANSNTAIIGTFHIITINWWQTMLTRLLGIWLRNSLKNFDKIFSVSQPAADFARKTFHVETTILPNPVDVSRFAPRKPFAAVSNQTNIVFLGRLVPRKGCLNLLIAVDYLNKHRGEDMDIKLQICGNGPEKQKLEQFVINKGLENIVTFHGFVTETEKIKQLQNADIAIFPSLGGESFGIVLVEAMAARSGVVLGGNNPGYKSVLASIPESLFDPNNPQAIANTLKKYIDNKLGRISLHKKQQQLVRKFDVEVVGQQLIKTYTDCINRRKSR